MVVSVLVFSPGIEAQSSDKSDENADTCDIQIAPIDSQQLAADPERTKARIIARMLQDMDRCLGLEQSRIASAQQVGNTNGTQSASQEGQNVSSSVSSAQSATSAQSTSQESQISVQVHPADRSGEEPNRTVMSDILRTVTKVPTSIQNNTSVWDIDSDDELVLDDYAKTLHEAYLAETDPVLKEALGKELTNYLNKNQR